ncbi:MAG TPA: alpha,alpha-trehalase TreF [Candidatus Saccharimonadales bacterium]|jgi:alpha,alpha-trehalase|nr:alpha,alpha-trehalase TreF [Candidatus Saccharimonadales bacterium]
MPQNITQQQMQKLLQRLQTKATLLSNGKLMVRKSPDEQLGELFKAVQLNRVHDDGKTFVDAVPNTARRKILRAYEHARKEAGFDLTKFVSDHFTEIADAAGYQSSPTTSPQEHIMNLWPVLTRNPTKNSGSLLSLPHPYAVPGGRFQEQFYWDSYFIMLGLVASGKFELTDDIMRNFAYMIRKFGYIPTGNRTYFLSRSQPPFFARMVQLIASYKGKRTYLFYLPYLLKEYQFWMSGSLRLSSRYPVHRRVVRMPNGTILNRYYDDKSTPRPESYGEDVETAHAAGGDAGRVYLDLRAAAESGWDFSSRWLRDEINLKTIHTTDIIPIDLNCLLYDLEMTIAKCYEILRQSVLASHYRRRAHKRASALREYCWNEAVGFFFDYDFVAKSQTKVHSLAGAFPLYSGLATAEEAGRMASHLRQKFLQSGGLLTSLHNTGQQWDAPNGWAPLQWITIVGLRNYDQIELANEIAARWVQTNLQTYETSSKLVEKYNVVNHGDSGGGGEYPLQDGFGWTNGVLLQLLQEQAQP